MTQKQFGTLMLLIGLVFLMLSCRKWNLSKFPTVKTQSSTNVKYYSATINGTIIEDGGAEVTDRGFCWSTTTNPKLQSDSSRSVGAGNDSFSIEILNLVPGRKYYYRAYATNAVGTEYGMLDSFTTFSSGVPAVKTMLGLYVTDSSAVCGDSLLLDGGAPITSIGFVWDSVLNPNENSPNKRTHSNSEPYFLDTIRNLRTGTTYYVRAFASNKFGTGYGDQLSFRTGGNQVILPLVTTSSVTNITKNSAKCGGVVLNSGWAPVTVRGIVWGSSPGPTVALSTKTVDGNDIGAYTSLLTGLTASSSYYIRAYASNVFGTTYGDEISFSTVKVFPSLTTSPISAILNSGVSCGGNISDDGGTQVTARGVVWSTSPDPTVTLTTKTIDGSGIGIFTSNLVGLLVNTTYYARAYATNLAGTGYGNQVVFETSTLPPSITTTAVSSITPTTAISGGESVASGGSSLIAYGVCWSPLPNPTVSLSTKTIQGSTAVASFSSTLNGLVPGITYHVRAYATNSLGGTSYGLERVFATPPGLIGDFFGGGRIAYILSSGDYGYDSSTCHGLIAAPNDQSLGIEWGCLGILVGGTSSVWGSGVANTAMVSSACGAGTAARLCADLVLGGYTDWCLPSKDDLMKLYLVKDLIGGFSTSGSAFGYYWTSSEYSDGFAWVIGFTDGVSGVGNKQYPRKLRAVRYF